MLVEGHAEFPPCFYIIGILGSASLEISSIHTAYQDALTIASAPGRMDDKVDSLNALMEASPANTLIKSLSKYLQSNFVAFNAVFSVLEGYHKEMDIIHMFGNQN